MSWAEDWDIYFFDLANLEVYEYLGVCVCVCVCVRMCAKSLQLCLSLCDPVDCSPPGSSVHRILQARILEWVAMSSFRRSSQPRDRTCVSCIDRQVLYH